MTERTETEALWDRYDQAVVAKRKAERRLHKLLELLLTVEWSNRRATGENARKLVSEALRGYHSQFFKDDFTRVYPWVDGLEIEALRARLDELNRQQHQEDSGSEQDMRQVEAKLEPKFAERKLRFSVHELVQRFPECFTTKCVVTAHIPGDSFKEVARADTWPEALKQALAWVEGELPQEVDPTSRGQGSLPKPVGGKRFLEDSEVISVLHVQGPTKNDT